MQNQVLTEDEMKTQYDPNLMEDRAIAAIDNVPLSAAELGSLWNTYMQYSLFVCVFKHFHKTTEILRSGRQRPRDMQPES